MLPNFSNRRARSLSVVSTLAATLYLSASPAAMAACTEANGAVTCTGPSTGAVNPQPPVANQASTAGRNTATITIDAGSVVSVSGFNVINGANANNVDTNTGVATGGTLSYGGVILPQIYHFDEDSGPGGTPAFQPPIEEGEDAHENDVDVVDNAGVRIVNNGTITSANVNPAGPGSAATRNTYGVFLTGSNNRLTNNGTISIGNAFSTSTMYGVFSSVPTGENYYDNNRIINNGTIEVTRSGAGTARAIYFGEQQLGMIVRNNEGGVIRATRVGAVAATSTNVTAAIDTDDTPGFLSIDNEDGATIEVTGAKTSGVFGRATQVEIENEGVIRNNSWTSADGITAAHYAIGVYAGSQFEALPGGDDDNPVPNIQNGFVAVESAAKLSLTNTETGLIVGDVLAVDANPFTAYVLGGGFAQSATSGNLSATNISTRDSEIVNEGVIQGNVYLGSGSHEVSNFGTITGNIVVNQEYMCRGTGAQAAAGCVADGTYRIGGDRFFSLTNEGILGDASTEIRIVDYNDNDVESLNLIGFEGDGFSGSLIAVNGVGDNRVSFDDDMAITRIQGFRTFALNGATVSVTGAGGVTAQDDATIFTTITGEGGTLLAPSTEIGRFAFTGGGTLALGGDTTITPSSIVAITDGAVYQVATSSTGGPVEATDSVLIDWTASQDGATGLLLTAAVNDAADVVPDLSQPAIAALNSLPTIDGSDEDAAELAGAVQGLQDPEDVRRAGEQLAPDTSFATQQAALMLSSLTAQGIDARLSEAGSAAPASQSADRTGADLPSATSSSSGLWAHVFGAKFDQDRKSRVNGYDADIYGAMAGVDHWVTDELRLGAALGYAHTRIDGKGDVRGNRTEADSYLAMIYGAYEQASWYAKGRAGYIYHDYNTKRSLDVALPGTAIGDFKGHQWLASFEAGAPMTFGSATVTPLAQVNYNHLKQNAYSEGGAAFALRIKNKDLDSLQTGLGVKADLSVADGVLLQARAIWLHEFADQRQSVNANFAGGAAFTARGPKVGRDAANLGLGVTASLQDGVTVQLDYDALLREKFMAHGASGKVRIAF